MGMHSSAATPPRSNGNAAGCSFFGRRFGSLLVDCHWRRRRLVRPTGVRTGDEKSLRSAALPFGHCVFWGNLPSPLVEAESASDKKPKLCVSV